MSNIPKMGQLPTPELAQKSQAEKEEEEEGFHDHTQLHPSSSFALCDSLRGHQQTNSTGQNLRPTSLVMLSDYFKCEHV